jgi:hypothetical protein
MQDLLYGSDARGAKVMSKVALIEVSTAAGPCAGAALVHAGTAANRKKRERWTHPVRRGLRR